MGLVLAELKGLYKPCVTDALGALKDLCNQPDVPVNITGELKIAMRM
jgi:hypothetical protein